ncbi:hypothetical protein LBW46_21750, partial [Ralstonia solanacearum]
MGSDATQGWGAHVDCLQNFITGRVDAAVMQPIAPTDCADHPFPSRHRLLHRDGGGPLDSELEP